MENTTQIKTLNQLQKLMPRLLEQHKKDTSLLRAAMANPILALEHLGIQLSPSIKTEVERRLRFDKSTRKKIATLEQRFEKLTGKNINLSDTAKLKNFLKKELSKKDNSTEERAEILEALDQPFHRRLAIKNTISQPFLSVNQKQQTAAESKDPLLKYKKSHEILPIVISYRALDSNFPALASKKTFDQILEKKATKTGVRFSKVQFRLQDRPRRKATKATT